MLFTPAPVLFLILFFFNDTATTEIYTLSLHDALPISRDISCRLRRRRRPRREGDGQAAAAERHALALLPAPVPTHGTGPRDRKSTRLNSSHGYISYAVFCLKKKKKTDNKTKT